MTFFLAASLFLTNPFPLDMPRASSFLIQEHGLSRLEDRFSKVDLWVSKSVDGRWMDEAGRVFMLAHLATRPPRADDDTTLTRVDFLSSEDKIDRRDEKAAREAIQALSPIEIADEPEKPRHRLRGFREIEYWQGTNESAVVCAYRLEKEEISRLAVWVLAEGDKIDEAVRRFEEKFLETDDARFSLPKATAEREKSNERALQKADVAHSVAAYDLWHVTDGDDWVLLDALSGDRDFVTTLTNELFLMRKAYAAAVPTSLNLSNTLSVLRIYASRADYLDALSLAGLDEMTWSAAYWSPMRRELVAYLPSDGEEKLLETIRHEAWHQYLSYASSFLGVSPWLNEGYAQYFEGGADGPATFERLDFALFADLVEPLLKMDYAAFYAGSDEDRLLKYRLAFSLVYFLEKGAPKVRFEPFKNLKKDYFNALLETRDMLRATEVTFKDEAFRKKFVSEWKTFWENP